MLLTRFGTVDTIACRPASDRALGRSSSLSLRSKGLVIRTRVNRRSWVASSGSVSVLTMTGAISIFFGSGGSSEEVGLTGPLGSSTSKSRILGIRFKGVKSSFLSSFSSLKISYLTSFLISSMNSGLPKLAKGNTFKFR